LRITGELQHRVGLNFPGSFPVVTYSREISGPIWLCFVSSGEYHKSENANKKF